MSESKSNESGVNYESPINKIGLLITMLLQPAEAGGLSERDSKRIYYSMMECLDNLTEEGHRILLDDIIEKWAPEMKKRTNSKGE